MQQQPPGRGFINMSTSIFAQQPETSFQQSNVPQSNSNTFNCTTSSLNYDNVQTIVTPRSQGYVSHELPTAKNMSIPYNKHNSSSISQMTSPLEHDDKAFPIEHKLSPIISTLKEFLRFELKTRGFSTQLKELVNKHSLTL